MCDCCKKIIVQNEVAVPGPPGPTGSAPIFFETDSFVAGAASGGLEFTHTLAASGTYIVQLEYQFSHTGAIDVTTQLTKTSVLQVANINYSHTATLNASSPVLTYTHTAQIIAVAGDTIGYTITSPCTGDNGSLTIIKIA